MTLRDYVRVIFRQKIIILTSIIVIMAIVILGLSYRTPMYKGTVKMLISGEKQVDSPFYKELMAIQDTEVSNTQSEIVTSVPVLRKVVDALHLYDKPIDYESEFASPLKKKFISLRVKMFKAHIERMPRIQQYAFNYQRALEDLRGNIKVVPIKETNIFTINVKDYDPVGAAVLANVVSRAYVIFDLEQQLAELQQKYGSKHPMVMQLHDNIERMTKMLSGRPMTNLEALGTASVKIIEQASIPFNPVGISGKLIMLAALFASIFMGMILAFIFEYMDQSIKSARDVEDVLGVPLFGTVPFIRSMRKLLLLKNFDKIPKRYNIVFQNLANQLRLMMTAKSFKTVLVTAADVHDGNSTLVANLGIYAAQGGARKVLIIDANFRDPAMHKIFGVPQGPGLVDILAQQASIEDVVKSARPCLSVLTAGQTTLNPMIFLDSPRTREILEKLKAQFDLVLIDCTDLNTSQEGCLLGACVDKTIFVVSENQTRRPVALKVLAHLKEHKASILGVILNKCTYPIPKFIYNRV